MRSAISPALAKVERANPAAKSAVLKNDFFISVPLFTSKSEIVRLNH